MAAISLDGDEFCNKKRTKTVCASVNDECKSDTKHEQGERCLDVAQLSVQELEAENF